jgi:hypothetical protein
MLQFVVCDNGIVSYEDGAINPIDVKHYNEHSNPNWQQKRSHNHTYESEPSQNARNHLQSALNSAFFGISSFRAWKIEHSNCFNNLSTAG